MNYDFKTKPVSYPGIFPHIIVYIYAVHRWTGPRLQSQNVNTIYDSMRKPRCAMRQLGDRLYVMCTIWWRCGWMAARAAGGRSLGCAQHGTESARAIWNATSKRCDKMCSIPALAIEHATMHVEVTAARWFKLAKVLVAGSVCFAVPWTKQHLFMLSFAPQIMTPRRGRHKHLMRVPEYLN